MTADVPFSTDPRSSNDHRTAPRWQILQGEALATLRTLPDESVHCVTTSPPYWGLRDYGTGRWEGGAPECAHTFIRGGTARTRLHEHGATRTEESVKAALAKVPHATYKSYCKRCGARRIDDQLGLEDTPEEFVSKMVAVFREVRRVLRHDGTCWINIGDSYAGKAGGFQGRHGQRAIRTFTARIKIEKGGGDLKPKDLVGIPWMLAFALRADGWHLRSEVIWHKLNPMPESVRDRPTKAHEQVFLLTKSPDYYYDADAIKEPVTGNAHPRGNGVNPKASENARGSKQNSSFSAALCGLVDTRNKRSVWSVASQPYDGAHFATFPPNLIAPCILAGCPAGGTVLDPFGGSGTTACVAVEHGRSAILIELNPAYVTIARERIARHMIPLGLATPDDLERADVRGQLGLMGVL